MSSRLNEESVVAKWDQGLSLSFSGVQGETSLIPRIDLNAIIQSEKPSEIIQQLDRRDLYLALRGSDLELVSEVLPHLSQEQFVALIDADAWSEDRISLKGAVNWLNLYRHHGLDQMFKRYRELDEEYQTALLAGYVTIADEDEYEKLSHEEQDRFVALPCNTLWYKVHSDDEVIQSFVDGLIQGGLGEDVQYTYSLLSHLSYLPPSEQEHMISQFRKARLEEDGFALPEESAVLFMPYDSKELELRWSHLNINSDEAAKTDLVESKVTHGDFFDRVLAEIKRSKTFEFEAIDNLQKSLLMVANMAASACSVDPKDILEIQKILQNVRALVGLGLERLSKGNAIVATEILFSEGPKTIFRFAISLIDILRFKALDILKIQGCRGVDKLEQSYKLRRFGRALWTIDQVLLEVLDFENTEMLKGLFNRLPLVLDTDDRLQAQEKARFKPVASIADLRRMEMYVENLGLVSLRHLEAVTLSGIDLPN